MGEALGTILPLAVAIAIFPIPVIASVLLVGTERGSLKGLSFVVGWLAGLAVVGGVVLAGSRAGEGGAGDGSATWTSVVVLLVGVALLALAVKQWRGRPAPGQDAPVPGWMASIDRLAVSRVVGLGFALSGLNPKNVLLTVAAAAEIAYFDLPGGQELAVLAVFVLLASAGVLAPLVLSVVLGDRSNELLDGLRGWMVRNNATIMSVLFVLIGAKLIGDAITGLAV